MAETQEEVPGAGGPNRTLLWIMLSVAVLFVVAGLAVGSSSETSTTPPLPPGNARALVVPSDDARRTVVVAPCGTDVEETARRARGGGESVPNSVRFDFPRQGGDRAVLVPDCSPKSGVSGTATGIPAAAFVLPVGTKENRVFTPPIRAESQVIVPSGSDARIIVLTPCTGQLGGEGGRPAPAREGGANQDAVLEPEAGQGNLATAPQC